MVPVKWKETLWLAMAIVLLLILVTLVGASTIRYEETDLTAGGAAYEVNRDADADLYVSDNGAGTIWHIHPSGVYTRYHVNESILDAKPDAGGAIWWTNGANTFGFVSDDTMTSWQLPVGRYLWGLTFDDSGRVWMTEWFGSDSKLYSFDLATTQLCTYTLPGATWSQYVRYESGQLWLANWFRDRIYRLDSSSGHVDWWQLPDGDSWPVGLVLDGQEGLWWADSGLGALAHLESATGILITYTLPAGAGTDPQMVEVGQSGIWYSEVGSGTVGVLDPAVATGVSATLTAATTTPITACSDVGPGTQEVIVIDSGSLGWTSGVLEASVDANGWKAYELPDEPFQPAIPYGLAESSGYLWVADQGRQKLLRLSPPLPAVALEKSTNGQDADNAPGPYIVVGGPITWTYVVSNTGNVPLAELAVVDDQGVAVTCPTTTLSVEASMVCTATGVAVEGQYANTGIVTGTAGADLEVTASDPSHYYGATPAVALQKHTNGEDADAPPGPNIQVGEPVTWTYMVTNSGNVTLLGISVVDDQGMDVSCPTTTLSAEAAMVCTATGAAVAGQYTNTGTVTGVPPGGLEPPTAEDRSHYFGFGAAIDLEKYTNGQDADVLPGPEIRVGQPVTWTYVVSNIGDDLLTAVDVVDDQGLTVACPTTTLAVQASMVCTATGVAVPGQYTNTGSVTAAPSTGPLVTAVDVSHYLGYERGSYIFLPTVLRNR
jgi:streptogramin lyase